MSFDRAAVVLRAKLRVARLLGARPPDVRARMPFDPDDPHDVETWLMDRIARRRWRDEDTEAFAVNRLVWAAQKTARRMSLDAVAIRIDSLSGAWPTDAAAITGRDATGKLLATPRPVSQTKERESNNGSLSSARRYWRVLPSLLTAC
jgi:hypothetical protein